MAKELPYFKFFPSEWVTGDITLCNEETQGVFITICAFYWMKDCSMSLANAKQRFSKNIASLDYLLEQKIIKVDEEQNIVINFLDKQMNEFINVAEKRAIAGARGGLAKAKQLVKFAKAKPSNKDKEKEEEKDKEKDIIKNIVQYLNSKLQTTFKYNSKKTVECINACLNEKFTYEDFVSVIDYKCKEWLNNEKMKEYLRPETLFSNKFEGYLQASKLVSNNAKEPTYKMNPNYIQL